MIPMAHCCTIRKGTREGNLSLILVEGNCKWLHVTLLLIRRLSTLGAGRSSKGLCPPSL
jgi:hypothetical protein